LTIDLILNMGGFSAGWTKAERDAARGAANLNKTLRGIQNSFKAALGVIGAGALVASIVKNTAEAEKAFALLSNAVKTSGGAAGFTADQLADMATELQKTTTYSDEAVQGAEQLLLRFQSIQGVNFKGALQSTLDLATALGKDLNSAALLVGKALESPEKGIKALAKAGVVLDKAQEDTIKQLAKTGHQAEAQAMLLKQLEQRYAGAASAARNTFGGALEGLKNAFGDLLEGKGGVPDAVDAINELTDVLNSPEVKAGAAALVNGILKIIEVTAKGAAELSNFAKYVGETFAAFTNGPGDQDLVRLSDSIVEIQDEVKRLKDLGGIGTALHGGSEAVQNEIASYERQLEKLTDKYNAAREAAAKALNPAAGGTGAAAPTTPTPEVHSEEFTKLEEHLKEQIALYGRTGEAAKLSAKIQSGALDDLSKSEQEELLKLARAYDDLGNITGHVFTQMEKDQMIVADGWKEVNIAVEDALKAAQMGQDDLAAKLADEMQPHLEENLKKYEDMVDKQNEYQLEAARNTQDILGTFLDDAMQGHFDNILKSFGELITKLVAQAIAADVAGKLFGTGKGGDSGLVGKGIDWITGLLGKAGGGPVNAGHLYRVNEFGMETLTIPGKADYLMMGGQAGSITPAGSTPTGGRGVTQNIYVTGSVTERTARQISIQAVRSQRAIMRLS